MATAFAASMALPPPTATTASHPAFRYNSLPWSTSKSLGFSVGSVQTLYSRPTSFKNLTAWSIQPAFKTPRSLTRKTLVAPKRRALSPMRFNVPLPKIISGTMNLNISISIAPNFRVANHFLIFLDQTTNILFQPAVFKKNARQGGIPCRTFNSR